MTGRYEEPETRQTDTRREGQWHPPAVPPAAGASQEPWGQPVEGPAASSAAPGSEPLYIDPSNSGPYPVGGGPSGPHQVDPSSSGPYYVEQTGSGPLPQQVGGGPSGPYPVSGGPSGPHQVDPSSSGPYYVEQTGSGPVPQQGYSMQPLPPQGFPPQQQYHQQQPQQGGQQPFPPQQARSNAPADLATAHLVKQNKKPPQTGWRKAVYVASGRLVNLGESPTDLTRRDLIARVNQPVHGCYKIAMLSLKGGVGKTTTTASLGSTFSSLRGDRVIAVDANPDRGTLAQKIPLETTATVRHLLRDAQRIRRYSDVRAYTSQGPSRLEVLASEQDPAVSEAFSEEDYRRTVSLLEIFYNLVLTDCGTGLMHSAMRGVLDLADSLVVVSSGSVDGARSASATLDWLDAHGYRDLVSRSVAVINSVRPKSGKVDLDRLSEHFAARCRAVCRIPFDPHLEEGAEIELERLAPDTRLAMLDLAATVADDFPHAVARTRAH